MFEAIANDSTSSASVLTALAASELADMIEASKTDNPGAFWEELRAACRELVAAKREMASIINLAGRVLAVAERMVLSGAASDTVRRAVYLECSMVRETGETGIVEIGIEGAALVPPGGTVATVSASESVKAVVAAAVSRGTECRVLLSESRPANEGVGFAADLASMGVRVTLVVDAALPNMVEGCGLALVGADAVSERDFINKVGTYALALAARSADVPVYVAALTDKFIPEGARGRPDAMREPGDVLPDAPAGVTVENRCFERVPLSIVDGVVTEGGVVNASDVPARVAAHPVTPALLEMLFPRVVESSS